MNRKKREQIPFEYRRNRHFTERIGDRCEVYTACTLRGQLLPLDPDVVSRINGKLI